MAAPMYAETPLATSRGAKFKPCSVDGCAGNADRSASGYRGWCGAHYQRWRRHGDPLGGRPAFDGDPMRFIREIAVPHHGNDCLVWPFAKSSGGRGRSALTTRSLMSAGSFARCSTALRRHPNTRLPTTAETVTWAVAIQTISGGTPLLAIRWTASNTVQATGVNGLGKPSSPSHRCAKS